ncbi:aminoacetone oxidase family FAD-binding enzyme [Anaerococcus nagyae]|uniref:aminoacetone oxidase family FAD-binding enzyme n=1 Tax=Anaerococcus nagyae TaxID=1755241 RepID=UPI001AE7ADF8|nr:aminoacetone oxidase family FAD-binding enzyme [Anaerococcus nagyae]MBP2069920.1 putative Rossmann fold flavoprotein [Anaerococcus nagyae]
MKIIVIGAGVAGLFFANFMGKSDVKVLDKNEFAGRKLLATGNGRCNFTNLNYGVDNFTSSNDDFVKNVIDYFTNMDLIEYFHELGIATTHLPSGRCYPKTMSSKTVRDILYLSAKESIEFMFDEKVTGIDFKRKKVKTSTNNYSYDKLVIAAGGITLKNSGSDGKIFELIEDEIPITKMTYAITNYETKEKLSKKAKGTKVSARASLFVDGKYVKESVDDVIFQDYGLTGTAILDISNDLSLHLMKNRECEIRIDFFPEYNRKDFRNFLFKLSKKFPSRPIKDILIGIINEKLIDDILNISNVSLKKISGNLSDKDFDNLTKSLKNLSFSVKKIHDKENAQVTIGGVDIKYIDPKTMTSTIYPDVFFIGECQEVAGACGGYNISWAASTAKIASDYIRSLDV